MSVGRGFEIPSGCLVQLRPLSPVSIIIFVNHFFGIRTEALRASVIDLACEQPGYLGTYTPQAPYGPQKDDKDVDR